VHALKNHPQAKNGGIKVVLYPLLKELTSNGEWVVTKDDLLKFTN